MAERDWSWVIGLLRYLNQTVIYGLAFTGMVGLVRHFPLRSQSICPLFLKHFPVLKDFVHILSDTFESLISLEKINVMIYFVSAWRLTESTESTYGSMKLF